MKITQIPLAALRLQYRIVRAPLRLFEDRVLNRVDPEAPGRLLYERSVGTVDATVGGVLGDDDALQRGATLIQRSEALGEATRLDQEAKQKRQQADAKFEQERESVASAPVEARKAAQRKADQARSTAEQRKKQAADAAAKQSAEAKQRIDEAAANKVTGVEAAKRAKQQTATAAEKAATDAAKAELDDAAEKRSEAVDKRAHAERVDELADAEKEQRQEARAED